MSEIIQDLSLEDVIGDRFGRYSKYIIQERALPDVRDGLKPVQRMRVKLSNYVTDRLGTFTEIFIKCISA